MSDKSSTLLEKGMILGYILIIAAVIVINVM